MTTILRAKARLLAGPPLLAVLAACGSTVTTGGGGGIAVPTHTVTAVTTVTRSSGSGLDLCRRSTPSPTDGIGGRAPLAAAFSPVVAVRCTTQDETVAGTGTFTDRVASRGVAGLTALVTALRAADTGAGDAPCVAMAQLDPDVWLVDASGDAVLPRWPRGTCAFIQPGATAALTAMTWVVSGKERLALTVPQAVTDSGCATQWKDMVAVEAASGTHGAGSFAGLAGVADPSVCRYRVTEQGSVPVGTFESGEHATAARWSHVVAALAATGPAAPCSAAATRFAVLAGSAYVELDGCHRVLTGDNGLRQAGPALLAALAAP